MTPLPKTKICVGCNKGLPTESFYKNRKGVHNRCKTCYIGRNKIYQEKYRNTNRFPIRVRSCRARAKAQDVPFNITSEYLEEIWTGTCPVFDTPLQIGAKKDEQGHAQLDRIVPSLGYTKGNVVWLSQRANRIKNDANTEDLERLLTWLKSKLL